MIYTLHIISLYITTNFVDNLVTVNFFGGKITKEKKKKDKKTIADVEYNVYKTRIGKAEPDSRCVVLYLHCTVLYAQHIQRDIPIEEGERERGRSERAINSALIQTWSMHYKL